MFQWDLIYLLFQPLQWFAIIPREAISLIVLSRKKSFVPVFLVLNISLKINLSEIVDSDRIKIF